MPAIDEERILEKVIPKQVQIKGFYEFYYYPENNDIAVSRDGKVLDLRTNTILKRYITKKCIVFVCFRVNNKPKFYSLHRLLAITFLGRPRRHLDKSFKQLDINHIDGDKLNNVLPNLEWCTKKENNEHSHKNNLHSKDKQILVKNIVTGEEKIFYSNRACARYFKIDESTLREHLKKNKNNYQRNDYQIKAL